MYKLKCVSQRFYDNLSIVRPSDPASRISFDLHSLPYLGYRSAITNRTMLKIAAAIATIKAICSIFK